MNGRNIVFQGNVGNLISTNIRWGSDLSYVSIYIIIRAISFDKNNNPYLKVHVQHYIMCSDFLQDKRYFIDQFGPNERQVNKHWYVYMTKIQMVKNEQENKNTMLYMKKLSHDSYNVIMYNMFS